MLGGESSPRGTASRWATEDDLRRLIAAKDRANAMTVEIRRGESKRNVRHARAPADHTKRLSAPAAPPPGPDRSEAPHCLPGSDPPSSIRRLRRRWSPNRFGRSSPFSWASRRSFRRRRRNAHARGRPSGAAGRRALQAELFTSMLALTTTVCRTWRKPWRARRAAWRRRDSPEGVGLELAAVGTWPTAVSEREEVDRRRGLCLRFAEYAGSSARRQHCAGPPRACGRGEPRECMGRLEAVLPCLPVGSQSRRTRRTPRAPRQASLHAAELLALLPRSGAPARVRRVARPGHASPRASCASGSQTTSCASGGTSGRTLDLGRSRCASRSADPARATRRRSLALTLALVVAADPSAPAADRVSPRRTAGRRQVRDGRRSDPPRGGAARDTRRTARRAPRARGAGRSPSRLCGPPRALDSLDQAGAQLEIGRRDWLRSSARRSLPSIRWSVNGGQVRDVQVAASAASAACCGRHALEQSKGSESAHANLAGDVTLALG